MSFISFHFTEENSQSFQLSNERFSSSAQLTAQPISPNTDVEFRYYPNATFDKSGVVYSNVVFENMENKQSSSIDSIKRPSTFNSNRSEAIYGNIQSSFESKHSDTVYDNVNIPSKIDSNPPETIYGNINGPATADSESNEVLYSNFSSI